MSCQSSHVSAKGYVNSFLHADVVVVAATATAGMGNFSSFFFCANFSGKEIRRRRKKH